MPNKPSQLTIFINLGLVYVVWGSTFLGVHFVLEVLPPMLTSALRFLIGGTILFIFTLLRGQSIPKWPQWKAAATVGFCLVGVGNSAVAYMLQYMPTGLVALLVAGLPAWTVLLDYWFFSKSKPNTLTVIGMLLGLVGMFILLNPFAATGVGEVSVFSVLLIFVGSICWAYGSLLSPYLPLPSQVQSTAIQMLTGGVFSAIMSFLLEPNAIAKIPDMTTNSILAMAYLIFIGSFIGYSAYTWLVNNAPPSLVSTYAYVNPVVAIFLAWLLIDEKLSNRSFIASSVILGGVVLITLGRRK
jgi:drug/metabolite transporter (DMT)-like permease